MNEIGGFIQFERFQGAHYHSSLPLNTGRSALLFLLRSINAKKVFIPYYLCDSVKNYLQANHFCYDFYHIDSSFMPIFDYDLKSDEYILIVNTYGQISKTEVLKLKQQYKNIILDNTHAFFELPLSDVHIFYSCRKFFGVPDGAYLHIADFNQESRIKDLSEDKSHDRFAHLLGRFEEPASSHYSKFQEAESVFGTLPPLRMSKLTSNLLNIIDYERIIKIRNHNFAQYAKTLTPTNKIDVQMLNGPFCYPYYVENGFALRKILIENKIYIPTLWSNITKEYGANNDEILIARNTLPLPVDQRITSNDVNYILKILRNT
ncbi:MAG: hypothetical protein GX959_03355 [Clostridiales bacterium]|nr:hypothetical protein [Clostridiales bacterium]